MDTATATAPEFSLVACPECHGTVWYGEKCLMCWQQQSGKREHSATCRRPCMVVHW